MLPLNREMPALSLPDVRGQIVSTRAYKQKRPLVLVFAGDQTALAEKFAEQYETYRAANAEVLAVVRHGPRAELPFPVLLDADGAATARYAVEPPAVLVTDAFGVLEGRFEGGEPDHDAIRNLVTALEMRCPECGVPEWPEDDESR